MSRLFKLGIAVVGSVAALAGGLAPVAEASSASIYACVDKETGVMRQVAAAAKCKKGERHLAWAIAGPSGPQGPAGSAGSAGTNGATGPAGASGGSGASGPAGPTGATGAAGVAGVAGADGAMGPIGPVGPSNGYSATAGAVVLSGFGPTIVVQTATGAVAGNYLVHGVVNVSDPAGGGGSTVSCYLSMNSLDSATSYVTLPDGLDVGGWLASISLTWAYVNVPADVHISITCNETGVANVVNSAITAVRVASLN